MISLMQVDKLTKSFGDLFLFEDITFGIAQGEKVGLIARNGAGKTTLMRIITGKEDEDSGQVVFRNGLRVGFLEQVPLFTAGHTVLQSMGVKPDSEEELNAVQLLTKLKIYDLEQEAVSLSGGQQKRVALARVLAHEPELLLLDEPTNHLDLEMVEWLEGYLSRANLSLLMVTHDRYFLDRVCNHIMEIDHGRLYQYKGNYSYYLLKRQERIDAFEAGTEKANNLYRKELDWIRRQPQARAGKAKYRIDAFEELEKRVKQRRDDSKVNLDVKASYIGSKIFSAEHVTKRFGDIRITEDFNYEFARYEKMGIAGDNGTGKTTFIRMLIGEVEPDSGRFDVGQTVRFGYYSQNGIAPDGAMKVIDAARSIAEFVDLGDGNKMGVSQFLQHFLFSPEKQYDYISKLSGGELRRLNLCMVLMRNPNFLILDEPTNDLDIMTLNVLEDYLDRFKGCVIIVSHDRYFMDRIADHLLVFGGDAKIRDFPGNYTQYREYRDAEEELCKALSESARAKQEPKAPLRKQPRLNDKKKLTYKEQYELEAIEELLPRLEGEKAALEASMSSGTLSTEELFKQSDRISQLIEEIEEKSMRWLELND